MLKIHKNKYESRTSISHSDDGLFLMNCAVNKCSDVTSFWFISKVIYGRNNVCVCVSACMPMWVHVCICVFGLIWEHSGHLLWGCMGWQKKHHQI